MKLIVGLGNPGIRYRNTRHNVGFFIVEALAKKNNIRIKRHLFKGLAGTGKIEEQSAMLFLPMTFMNLSGDSVILAKSKISTLSDMLVIYDDIDLSLGNMRFKSSGSSAGHKGVRSLIERLNTEGFSRLRIGIKSDSKLEDASDFVLKPFTKREKGLLDKVCEEAIGGIETWTLLGIEKCMERYNRKQIVDRV